MHYPEGPMQEPMNYTMSPVHIMRAPPIPPTLRILCYEPCAPLLHYSASPVHIIYHESPEPPCSWHHRPVRPQAWPQPYGEWGPSYPLIPSLPSFAACDTSAAPANGGIGDCKATLESGSSCKPTCNEGWIVSGNSVCSPTGMLTAATCARIDSGYKVRLQVGGQCLNVWGRDYESNKN